MHFVTGGAFHGKAKWVMDTYSASRKMEGWCNLYDAVCPEAEEFKFKTSLVVIEGMEQLVKKVVQENKKGTREVLKKNLQAWLKWESEVPGRQLVLIGTDIGKGIVPMEEENRRWRDVSGWFFQDAAMAAEKVHVVWYGLEQTIK